MTELFWADMHHYLYAQRRDGQIDVWLLVPGGRAEMLRRVSALDAPLVLKVCVCVCQTELVSESAPLPPLPALLLIRTTHT